MTGFVIAAALAVVFVLLLVLRVFVWPPAGGEASRRQLNAAIYREQLARLEQERNEGSLSVDEFAQAHAELQRRVLEDTSQDEAVAQPGAPRKTILAIVLSLPLAAAGLYALLGNPEALTSDAGRPHVAAQDVERMVAGLAAKLEASPDNPKGWVMLARSYKAMGRTLDAEKAFERAGSFIDDDAQVLAVYADVAASNAKGDFTGKPTRLIDKALKADPDNAMALWLSGTAAFKRSDFDAAIQAWERLLPLLPPDSDDARMIQGGLAEARDKGGRPAGKVAGLASPQAAPSVPGVAASVSGTVRLDPTLKSKPAPEDTVMVVARVPGSRVPVAVMRGRVSELPMSFKLDDSLSMVPQARMSGATEVTVEARISKSGMATPEPGDLYSVPQTVRVGAEGLTINVDQVRP